MQKRFVSHAEVEGLLRRVGYSKEQVKDMLRDFPDPIDVERDGDALFQRGISVGSLMNQMGGSP